MILIEETGRHGVSVKFDDAYITSTTALDIS